MSTSAAERAPRQGPAADLRWSFPEVGARIRGLLEVQDWSRSGVVHQRQGRLPDEILGLPPLALALWLANEPWQRSFPLGGAEERRRFVHWFAVHAWSFDLQSAAVPAVDWRWYERPAMAIHRAGRRSLSNLMVLLWSLRPDLQRAFPLDTAEGRRRFQRWGRRRMRVEYRRQLQLIDERRGRRGLRHRLRGWLRRSPRGAFRGRQLTPGLNLVEHRDATMGIREDGRNGVLALTAAGVPFRVAPALNAEASAERAAAAFPHVANLLHINADQMVLTYGQMGPQGFGGRRNVGYWLWELPRCPPELAPALACVDEVWVPSRFVRDAFAPVSSVPVRVLPYAVTAEPAGERDRGDFGLPPGDFLFLFSFDAASYVARKNPVACIEAFRRAFPGGDEKVGLVVKSVHLDPETPIAHTLGRVAAEDPRIHLLGGALERGHALDLVACCDAYLSLHRSEGFGRGPAEAMLLGKPVVVTGYGGCVDYATAETACVVDHRPIAVGADEYPFPTGQSWAEPDVDHASHHLRRLAADEALRRRLAEAGRRLITERYSPGAAGRRFRDRLEELGALPATPESSGRDPGS